MEWENANNSQYFNLSVNVHVFKLLLTLFIYIKRCRVIELSWIELIDWFSERQNYQFHTCILVNNAMYNCRIAWELTCNWNIFNCMTCTRNLTHLLSVLTPVTNMLVLEI